MWTKFALFNGKKNVNPIFDETLKKLLIKAGSLLRLANFDNSKWIFYYHH